MAEINPFLKTQNTISQNPFLKNVSVEEEEEQEEVL